MTITTKQKLVNYIYIFLSFWPMAYLISFVSFLYYTGNGFGRPLTFNPEPEKKEEYLIWLKVILELENCWIISFLFWILMLIVTFLFIRNIKTMALVTITTILFGIVVYINYFTEYGGHEGWIDDYWDSVQKINRR